MSKSDQDKQPPAPSPAAQRLAAEHGLDTESIEGSGEGGRLLQRDVMAALQNLADEDEPDTSPSPLLALPEDLAGAPAPQVAVEEVELSGVQRILTRWSRAFEDRHGLPPSLDSFVIKAIVEALVAEPDANVQLRDGRPERNQYYDLAVTIPSQRGLRTPVLRSPQRKGIAELEGELARFRRQVRDGSLPAESETGAVLTLHRRPGLLSSSPPLHAPQCLALALHRVQDRPVVVPGLEGPLVAVRPVCSITAAWDPRAVEIEGITALLGHIKRGLEQPERLWLEI
jgi:2-oxoglutarate dehydrogenase E2 component (dihydrolipoamide succinyltransferase)